MRNVFSLLGGLAAGALLGILFAPQSGEETRAKVKALIQEKVPNISKDKLEQLVDEVLEKVGAKERNVEAD
mgnify:CR=1 FL=1